MRLVHAAVALLCAAALDVAPATAAAPPAPVFAVQGTPFAQSMTPANPSRSRRVILRGSGFGGAPGQLLFGGVPAHIASWGDQRIAAYPDEATPLGTVAVTHVSAGTSTQLGTLQVGERPSPDGRTLWRFDGDALYFGTRPAVGSDGTVYAIDVYGHIYAIAPNGALLWIRSGANGAKSPTIDSNDTLYVAGLGALVTALDSSDGSTLWSVAYPSNAGYVYAGPNVGPNGDIYIATRESPGQGINFGVAAISPTGQLLWNRAHNIGGSPGSAGQAYEITAGPSGIYVRSGTGSHGAGGNARNVFALDPSSGNSLFTIPSIMWPRLGSDGNIYQRNVDGNFYGSYTPSGAQRWRVHHGTIGGTPTSDLVLDDANRFYVAGGPNLSCGDAQGQQQWRTVLGSAFVTQPGVSSTHDVVVANITPFDFSASKRFQGFDSATGQVLWSQDLGFDGSVRYIQSWNGRFSPDESVWYAPCSGNNLAIDPAAPLFAVVVTDVLPLGTSYCGPAAANTSGQSASIELLGSAFIADARATLRAADLPQNQFGFFLNAPGMAFVANPGGSQGNLCLGGAVGRHNSPAEIRHSGTAGAFELELDLSALPGPMGPHAVLAGETLHFQAWFRDIGLVGSTSNFTDGLEVQFR